MIYPFLPRYTDYFSQYNVCDYTRVSKVEPRMFLLFVFFSFQFQRLEGVAQGRGLVPLLCHSKALIGGLVPDAYL